MNISLSDADATLMREMAEALGVKYSTRFTSVSVKTVMKICIQTGYFESKHRLCDNRANVIKKIQGCNRGGKRQDSGN